MIRTYHPQDHKYRCGNVFTFRLVNVSVLNEHLVQALELALVEEVVQNRYDANIQILREIRNFRFLRRLRRASEPRKPVSVWSSAICLIVYLLANLEGLFSALSKPIFASKLENTHVAEFFKLYKM